MQDPGDRRIPDDDRRELMSFGSATVFEALGRTGALVSAIKPLAAGMTLAAPAFTCACPPGDNLTLHAALKLASRGDVIVCAAAGFAEQGLFGDVMASCAVGRGLAGLVTDGGVRDKAAIIAIGLPVFAAGICIKGTVKESLGPLRTTVALGGVAVRTGDIVVGDADGVVVVPHERVGEVLGRCRARAAKESALRDQIRSGRTPWELYGLQDILTRKGVTTKI